MNRAPQISVTSYVRARDGSLVPVGNLKPSDKQRLADSLKCAYLSGLYPEAHFHPAAATENAHHETH